MTDESRIVVTYRPAVVAFDMIDTLMSLEPLRERLTEAGQPPHLLEAWYTRTLRDGMALSATGDYVPFTDVAESSLRGLTGYTISDEQVAQIMAGFSELPAFPDAVSAVTSLTEAGLRVACLTNGSSFLASSFVNRSGLGALVDRVISVGEVYRWKPATVVYLYAAEVMGVPPERMALVAAHDWDCHGAKRAGLTTGWVSRKAGGFGAPFAPPDVVGENLTEVVAKLLALEPRGSDVVLVPGDAARHLAQGAPRVHGGRLGAGGSPVRPGPHRRLAGEARAARSARPVYISGPGITFSSTRITGHRQKTYGCDNHYTLLWWLSQPYANSRLGLGEVEPVAGAVRPAALLGPASARPL